MLNITSAKPATSGGKASSIVLNDALRDSLQPKTSKPELLAPRSMGLAPGVDPRGLSDLADDLEAEAYLAAESKRSYTFLQ